MTTANKPTGAAEQPQTPENSPVGQLLLTIMPRLQALRHNVVHFIMLDGTEPVSADVMAEKGPGLTRAAIYGRFMVSWHMSPAESPDGQDYRSMNYLPFKAWIDDRGMLCSRMEFPDDPRTAGFIRQMGDVVLLRGGEVFARLKEPNLEELYGKKRYTLNWTVFESFSPEGHKDFVRLKKALKLLAQPDTDQEVQQLLDKNFCPQREASSWQVVG